MSGSIEATGAITALIADLTVPTGVALTLGSTAALAPVGNVTVNGTLALGSGSITIASGKTLTIGATAAVSGNGVIKAEGASIGGTITILGVEGYTTTNTGVAGDALATAAAAIALSKNVLTDTIDFGYEGAIGIGAVGIEAANTATAINASPDGHGNDVTVGSGISLVAGTALTASDVKSPNGLNTASDFTLSLTEATKVSLADSGYTGSTDAMGLIQFSGVQLQHSGGLIGPVVPDFHVGVSTKR